MSNDALKYKLKGNETFSIREGWLAKGISALRDDKYIFSEKTAMDDLGVGSKMVRAIKYWLLASHLAEEKREKNSKHYLALTQDFGEIVIKYDPYFEDVFTLWIIHYFITRDIRFNTVWHLFFNRFNVTEFSKELMVGKIADEFSKIYDKRSSVLRSIDDDCGVLLKMYTFSDRNITYPEDNLSSPFSELGLISKGSEQNKYMKAKPIYSRLDRLAVLYVITCNLATDKISVDIDTLLTQDNNVGKIFGLDRDMINEYLDRLRQEQFVELNRTAGLDMVYVKNKLTPAEILELYYTQNETEVL